MTDDRVRATGIPRLKDDDCHLEPRGETRVRFGCGHEASERYVLFVKNHGEELELTVTHDAPDYLKLCGECRRADLVRTATRCSRCHEAILVGQQVGRTARGGLECVGDACAGPFGFIGHWKGDRVEPARFSMFGPM